MKYFQQFLIILIASLFLLACAAITSTETNPPESKPIVIAFMPDVHFHDIYGHFENEAFKGIATETANGTEFATIRSMQAQLQSTRLFNENYFALIAALDDVVARGIKYVALPGDFSDDGQPIHMRGLKKVLDKYHREHGIEFFATNGNHDPVKPFTHPAGKMDYLGDDGKEQPIFSHGDSECDSSKATNNSDSKKKRAVVCADDVQELGYEPIMELLGEHGFYPKNNYVYFETPYSSYTSKNYSYKKAKTEAEFAKRQYEICNQGTADQYKNPGKYKQENYTDCTQVPDSSYLVEPVNGVWLLAIDANVYQPIKNDFLGSGDAGYNKVITHKTHVIEWISDVVKRAEAEHKTLIAFSHFPMEEFYDGASDDIEELFGKNKFQLNRRPLDTTSKTLADTGLKVHVGGHMHMNDTGVFKSERGNVLFNIQAPSLAAYAPAYKLLTLNDKQHIEVETVVLKNVPRFKELFPHYQKEWDYLNSIGATDIWNNDILLADNYYDFTDWHLRELARLRFLPKEWPEDIRQFLATLNGRDMLILSQLQSDISLDELSLLTQKKINNKKRLPKKSRRAWQQAIVQAEKIAIENNLLLDDFSKWNGQDLSVDFFRLCNAEQLALKDISTHRIKQYKLLAQQLSNFNVDVTNNNNLSINKIFSNRFSKLLSILMQFTEGEPNDNFLLNIATGEIKDIQ